jgi:hypothetical protein
VQQYQVGEGASATVLEWNSGLNCPSVVFVNELTAFPAFAVLLLLPESFWEATYL